MATVKYIVSFIPTAGSMGTRISYRKDGELIWTTPQVPANPTTLSSFPIELQENSTYYISIASTGKNCQEKNIIKKIDTPGLTPCCPTDYTLSPDQTYCYKDETMAPVIETQNICVAPSTRSPEYSIDGTRFFASIGDYDRLLVGSYETITTPYWNGNPHGSSSGGNPASPMNREAIWIDSDCDGEKDALRKDAVLQQTIQIVVPVNKQVYVGIAGDNTFRLLINGAVIVDCDDTAGNIAGGGNNPVFNFTIWWIFPITLVSGPNLVSIQYIGDGSANDAAACAIYDNTAQQIRNASKDEDLNFLFRSSELIGKRIDIASCEPGYTLDTSAGSGNYICRRQLTSPPVTCP